MSTNIEGVFAGGDCVNGGKEVVDAVQAGKDGASAILSFLGMKESEPAVEASAFNSLNTNFPNS
jgi:glutamate synthase (NADPH/NADH) small chain